ncbi:MAG: FAD:protein FMN transferase, partial [Verrucomicrobiota bacterium]
MEDQVIRAAHHAMATPWELLIYHPSLEEAEAAANEAWARVDALEALLSRFKPDSDLARIANAARETTIPIATETVQCLELALAVKSETAGAFDIRLMRSGDGSDPPQTPTPLATGELFSLDPHLETVTVHEDSVKLDLGGIGKGYAIDELVPLLADWDIKHALINAGKSTLYAMGHPPEEEAWPVSAGPNPDELYPLTQQALSGSGFGVQGVHVHDPRTGMPLVTNRHNAWVFADSAALADALSTAVLVMSDGEIDAFHEKHPEIAIMIA